MMRLNDVALVMANFGNGQAFRSVLGDWFNFIGGKPGEVVVVDGGSDAQTQEVCWNLFCEGMIDKLQFTASTHKENHKDLCFIQEYRAGILAARQYLLFVKVDTLPFRQGHDDWLEQAIVMLDRPDVFAVGGSFNVASRHHEAWPGWYFSHKCSENFCLMKRESFVAATEEFAGEFIRMGFMGENPAATTGQSRYLVEVAFERYMSEHGKFTLVREEDTTWTIFHTNLRDEALLRARERYFRREGVDQCMNARGFRSIKGGVYYGQFWNGALHECKCRFGRRAILCVMKQLLGCAKQGATASAS